MSIAMKCTTIAALALAATTTTFSANVEEPFKVGDWANFCKGAISHTFDDYPTQGTNNQVGSGQAAFDEKGLHMTLFVQVGSVSDWSKLKTSFAKGHEIASHNMSHDVNTGTFQQAQNKVKENVSGEMCVTIGYPECNCSQDAATLNVYIAARTCNGAQNQKSPGNFAQINGQLVGSGHGYPNSANEFNGIADNAATSNGWAVLGHHGIGNDGHGWANTDMNALTQHLTYLDENRDKIWCETFGNVARYIRERDAADLSVKTTKADTLVVELKDDLPDSIFNYPLTIRRPLPDGWDTAIVEQISGTDTVNTEDTIVTIESVKHVMFKAIPDSSDIIIRKPVTTGVCRMPSGYSAIGTGAAIKVQSGSVIIDRSRFNGPVAITLFNLSGKVLCKYAPDKSVARIDFNRETAGKSACIVRVSDGIVTHSKMVAFNR